MKSVNKTKKLINKKIQHKTENSFNVASNLLFPYSINSGCPLSTLSTTDRTC